jgi:hypothetical protein
MDDFNLDLKIDFNEEDLNDPLLLAELAELVDESPKVQLVSKGLSSKTMVKTLPSCQEIKPVKDSPDVFDTIPVLPEFEEIGEVEVTEEDMIDPHLLAELKQVAGDDDFLTDSNDVNQVDTQRNTTQHHPDDSASRESRVESLDSKLKLTNTQMLQQYVQIEKVNALNKKRQGDKNGALDSLRNAKELSKRIDELQKKVISVEIISDISDQKKEPNVSSKKNDNPKKSEMNNRCVEYQKAAVSFKKNGQIEKAKEALSVAKTIQNAIDADDNLFHLPHSPQLHPLPISVDSNSKTPIESNPKAPLKATPSTIGSSENELVNHLVITLEQQIELCTKLSAQYFTSNQKDLALEFHKRKKNLLQDKETLIALKSVKLDSRAIPFKFNYSLLEYQIAQSNPQLSLDQVEFSITKGTDVAVKGENEPETGVLIDFGWPAIQSRTSIEGKFETKTVKGTNPSIDAFYYEITVFL